MRALRGGNPALRHFAAELVARIDATTVQPEPRRMVRGGGVSSHGVQHIRRGGTPPPRRTVRGGGRLLTWHPGTQGAGAPHPRAALHVAGVGGTRGLSAKARRHLARALPWRYSTGTVLSAMVPTTPVRGLSSRRLSSRGRARACRQLSQTTAEAR